MQVLETSMTFLKQGTNCFHPHLTIKDFEPFFFLKFKNINATFESL